jgi:hypothetical protein
MLPKTRCRKSRKNEEQKFNWKNKNFFAQVAKHCFIARKTAPAPLLKPKIAERKMLFARRIAINKTSKAFGSKERCRGEKQLWLFGT